MGTRNMTMVIDQEGEKKVAQYGQWDGYPSGQGVTVLQFLKNKALVDALKSNLKKVRFIDYNGVDKKFAEDYDKNAPVFSRDTDNRTAHQKHWFETYCHRDLGAKILTNIAESTYEEILLLNREQTAIGDGWVEWSYVINFKENTLGVYAHIDQPPIKVYNLDSLPEEDAFVLELEGEDEEE